MLIRLAAVTVVALGAAGCANDSLSPGASLSTGSLKAEAAPAVGEQNFEGETTMAAKVLTAIALENVTGRTPDPSRLDDLN